MAQCVFSENLHVKIDIGHHIPLIEAWQQTRENTIIQRGEKMII